MNKSIYMGRLVRDPEIRYAQTEKGELPVANFRLAVDRKFVRRDGVKTDYFNCSAFARQAELAEKHLVQGIKIIVSGRMENDNYQNGNGEMVYGMRLMVEEIEFAESKKAVEDRREAVREQEGRNLSSSRNAGRDSSARSGRSASSSRERNGERSARAESSRRPVRNEDYEDDRGRDRDFDRRSSERSTGGRNGSRSSGNSGSSRRGRDVDEEYMNVPDEELDFK